MTLRDMKEWQDWDGAAYELGLSLGLFSKERHPFSTKAKHVFWSRNDVGETLHEILERLVDIGVLEGRGNPDEGNSPVPSSFTQFRWNPCFHGSWEGPRAPIKKFTQEVFKDD